MGHSAEVGVEIFWPHFPRMIITAYLFIENKYNFWKYRKGSFVFTYVNIRWIDVIKWTCNGHDIGKNLHTILRYRQSRQNTVLLVRTQHGLTRHHWDRPDSSEHGRIGEWVKGTNTNFLANSTDPDQD